MAWQLAIAALSAYNSYQGYKNAGKAAMNQANLQNRQLKTQGEMIKLSALQEHNARMSTVKTFKGTNQATVGSSGRAEDRSFIAIQERADRQLAVETDRAYVQSIQKLAANKLNMNINTLVAQNKRNAYNNKAIGTVLSFAMTSSSMIGGSPTPTTSQGTGLGMRGGYQT